MKTKQVVLFIGISLFSFAGLQAQDFVYTPVNPAFGGNSYNYQWLLSSAQSQDKTEGPEDLLSSYSKDPLTNFEENLNRQILSQLSRRLVDSQFGEEELAEGTYEIGTFRIEITNEYDGVSIRIFDMSTGGETTVVIPYF